MKDQPSGGRGGNEAAPRSRKPGFYDGLFSAPELRTLELHPQISAEQELLRTLARRLAKLLPLKKLDDAQLDALLKLVRVVALIDALERTAVMRLKGGFDEDPLLDSITAPDVEDL